jgi:hypothetical protein
LREEHWLRVFENRTLRKIFGSKRDDITGEWRRLHNEENYVVYLPNIFRLIKSKRIKLARRVARMGDRRGAYMVLVEKPEEKIPLERPKCRWEDTIKTYLQKIG